MEITSKTQATEQVQTNPMTFAKELKDLRQRLGLSQVEAAAALHMSKDWVSICERGGSVPNLISQAGALQILRAAVVAANANEAAKAEAYRRTLAASNDAFAERYVPTTIHR